MCEIKSFLQGYFISIISFDLKYFMLSCRRLYCFVLVICRCFSAFDYYVYVKMKAEIVILSGIWKLEMTYKAPSVLFVVPNMFKDLL